MTAVSLILRHQMISTEKVMKIKVVEPIKLYNFCYGHLFISLNLNHSNFEFQQMTASNKILIYQMIRTQKVINIKVVELMKLYNFYFGHLFMWLNWNHSNFGFQQMIASNKNLTQQMIWTQKVMNIKVVVLIKIYNFYFGHLFMLLNLNNSNFEFQQMTTSNKILSHQTNWTKNTWT